MFCSVCYCLANKARICFVENTSAKPLCFTSSTMFLSILGDTNKEVVILKQIILLALNSILVLLLFIF